MNFYLACLTSCLISLSFGFFTPTGQKLLLLIDVICFYYMFKQMYKDIKIIFKKKEEKKPIQAIKIQYVIYEYKMPIPELLKSIEEKEHILLQELCNALNWGKESEHISLNISLSLQTKDTLVKEYKAITPNGSVILEKLLESYQHLA